MSDRTFRLILDSKKGGLVKGSTPSSAAKKACKKLLAETGKSSFKFELQEITKNSKKKIYGPYKGSFVKDKIKVKMAGGSNSNTYNTNNNSKRVYGSNLTKYDLRHLKNEDDEQLLKYVLRSHNYFNNNPNSYYFSEEKYDSFKTALLHWFSWETSLKKLLILKKELEKKKYEGYTDKEAKTLNRNISDIEKNIKNLAERKRKAAEKAAKIAAEKAAFAEFFSAEAAEKGNGKKKLLQNFLSNNAELHP